MSTADIESILKEDRVFKPAAEFVENATNKPADIEALYAKAEADHVGFWGDLGRTQLDWKKPFTVTLDDSDAPHFKWFTDGVINVSHNCLDRHLADRGDKPAIIWEGEPGDRRTITYKDLHAEVSRFANVLKGQGISAGDRVVLYMPMVPEAAVAMLACARIGAIHSVVFGGFSAGALKDRIEDAEAKAVITADGGNRGGGVVKLKENVDKALDMGGASIESVIVVQRSEHGAAMKAGRDHWYHELMEKAEAECEPEWVNSEHPLFILYTSGSTGKPKGVQHSSGGYLLGALMTCKWVFDLNDKDIFWCTADVGWITGHSYIVYGPLAAGTTIVMYEGAPTVPDAGRFWRMVEDYKVTIFYTAPTAIRALLKLGDQFPNKYDLSSLRILGTVGEPINPEAWMWYHTTIGKERCPIVDTWWQTETGAIMMTPLPTYTATKPGSCCKPLPGISPAILHEDGTPVTQPNVGGYLVMTKPWPSMLRTVWGDDQRYRDTYFGAFGHHTYVAGDSAQRDEDGYFRILGRMDDVLNVSGHRLGTMEIESALVAHSNVAEAAVVGRPHEIKGESIMAFVICRGPRPEGDEADKLVKELRDWVAEQLGAIAKPDDIRFTDALPKTRSGKIMRRLLKTIARGEEITQDTSTLENENVVRQLQGKE